MRYTVLRVKILSRKYFFFVLILLNILILNACQSDSKILEEIVLETVVVEKEVIKEVELIKEVEVEKIII